MDFLKIHLSKIIPTCITIIIFIIACIFIYNKYQKEPLKESPQQLSNIPKEPSEPDKYYVDIKGEVVNPGVYEITQNCIVKDIIDMAGGLTATADTSTINLASVVTNGELILIPKINQDSSSNSQSLSNTPKKISLNKATLSELLTLPGIGKSKAQEIIEYRRKCGRFKKIEEIQNISGIGPSTYEKLKNLISI